MAAMTTMIDHQILQVGIIGTGAIASSFAALFSGNGYATTVIGRSEQSLDHARRAYAHIFDTFEQRMLVTPEQRTACAARVSYSTRCQDAANAGIVFEAVYESLAIKHEVFKQLETHCPNVRAIASATSVLEPDDLKQGFTVPVQRAKLLVAHPFNPAHLIPLVELVGSSETSTESLALVKQFLEQCGKSVCLMKKSIPGFIANRIQHAMVREALYLIQQGIASAQDIDMVLALSFIPRYTKVGLTQHQDGYGLDMLENLQNYLYPSLCNEQGANALVRQAVKDGNLGQKTGKGLNTWDEASIAAFRRSAAEPYWQFFNWKLPEG